MPDAALLIARTLHFWAVATMVGGGGLLVLRRQPTPRAGIRALRIAAVLAAISGVAWFVCVFADVTGDAGALFDPDARSAFLGAPFGPPWALRLGLLALACALGIVRRPLVTGLLGLCLVGDQAWLGHAATGEGWAGIAQIGVYWAHVLAGFAWVGALVMLCVLATVDRAIPADALAIFSALGIAGVATILASGLVNAAFRLHSAADLLGTRYGLVLLTKLVLVTGMVAIAAYNRREAGAGRTGQVAAVAIETSLGLAVLAAAALLGVTAPPG